MTIDEVKKAIKGRGYWEINISPVKFIADLIPDRTACKELLRKSSVELRGWDYPHIPRQNDENQALYFGDDYCESYINWEKHKEALRFYQSGQLVHYLALWEDWLQEDSWTSDRLKDIKPGTILSTVAALYTITEIFEFLRRLTSQSNIYDSGAKIEIKLIGTNNRKLEVLDPMRAPLFGTYAAHVNEVKIPAREISKEDILNRSKDLAIDSIKYLFETFEWENQPIEVFKKDQQNLLERRL